jgi:hypothetical protein
VGLSLRSLGNPCLPRDAYLVDRIHGFRPTEAALDGLRLDDQCACIGCGWQIQARGIDRQPEYIGVRTVSIRVARSNGQAEHRKAAGCGERTRAGECRIRTCIDASENTARGDEIRGTPTVGQSRRRAGKISIGLDGGPSGLEYPGRHNRNIGAARRLAAGNEREIDGRRIRLDAQRFRERRVQADAGSRRVQLGVRGGTTE